MQERNFVQGSVYAMKQFTAIVIGAGNRGGHYAKYMAQMPENTG